MSDQNDMEETGEIKRLLERLQELAPTPDTSLGRLEMGGHPRPPVNPYLMQQPVYPHLQLADLPNAAARRGPTISPWLFVMATALNTIVAAVLAVLITLGVVRQEPARDAGPPTQIWGGNEQTAGARGGLATGAMSLTRDRPAPQSVRLRAIGSPDQPLRLEPNKPSRLPMLLEPETARNSTYILVLSGLPAGSSLTGAERISSDSWLLTPEAMQRLELTIPEWSTSLLEITVKLRQTDGAAAAETRAWLMVPPPTLAKSNRIVDDAALKEMIERSGQLLARGDIVAARTLYERAAGMGSGEAALALGATYDPNRLWSLGVFGMVGNAERARQWYSRAEQLGQPEAKERLRVLGD